MASIVTLARPALLQSQPLRHTIAARCLCNMPGRLSRSQTHSGFSGLAMHRQRRPQRQSWRASASLVEKLNAEELEVALSERDRPLVIDFSANWCGPCLLLAQELEKVAKELGDKVRLVKVDTDENPELSSQLQIQGLPTMVFVGVDKDKPALRTEGLLPAETIIEIIQKEMPQ